MTMFKKIATATQAIIDELKWPAIEASVKRRIDDKIQDVKDLEDKNTAARIDLIQKLGKTSERDVQSSIIDQIVALDRELFLVQQKADFTKALGDVLFAKAKED